ncbi:MAG: proline iminopeptidase-family hydrolase [Gammaproteobacteria bacterium]|nr:proline iminopeptidase-family hydrolase [Gammaproteobacteria bacterium]MCY4356047.1 proline iminopeptidase-family hydrolase [Gammaproteobacteria bacterium]
MKYSRMQAIRYLLLLICLVLSFRHGIALEPGQGFVNVAGGPIWYEVMGEGISGVPLLVLHGGPGGHSCGYTQLLPMASYRYIVRYDQLGGGRSGRPDDNTLWTVEGFVERLHSLRQSLGLEQMHLLGHSWGGALAAAYVLEKGSDGIVSLTLSSPLLSSYEWMEDARYLRSQLPESMQKALLKHEAEGTMEHEDYLTATEEYYRRHVRGGEQLPTLPACDGVTGNEMIYQLMWGNTEFNASGTLADFELRDALNQIDIPVLLVAGEHDEARPQTMFEFQSMIEGARVEIIPDAAHSTLSRQPERYMEILSHFLHATE